MASGLIKNTSIYTLGNFLPQIVSFILIPIYTSYLPPSEYGIVNSMNVLNSVFLILFTFSLDRGIYRLYYDYKTEASKRDYLGTITIGLLIISTLLLLLLFLANNLLVKIYRSIPFYPYYTILLLSVYLKVFSTVPNVYLRVSEKAATFVSISFFQFITVVALNLYFIIILKKGAIGMLLGQMFGSLIILPIYLIINYKIINIKFDFGIFNQSLKYSLPLLPSVLLAWVLNLSDRIFIERFLTLNDVGIYSLGYRIASLTGILAGGFFTAYNPLFYKIANSENSALAKKKLYKMNNVFILIILSITFFIVFLSKDIIILLISKEYHSSFKIIPLVALGYFFSQTTGLFNLMIYQDKKSVIILLITLICAGINIAFNFLLIPSFGIMGAAYSTFLSFLFMFIIEYIFAHKYYFIPINFKLIIPWFLGLGLLYIIIDHLPIHNALMRLSIHLVIILVLFIFIFLNNKKIIMNLIKKKDD
ncbi:MAG: oligosaccharide flippase family protein [Bacteroidales bacterium]|nr:oligosaccharide flippase family protein [Bacteroidales bacterium]